MTESENKAAAGWRRLLAVPIVVEALLLVGLCVLLAQALAPSFGGGKFVMMTLGLSVLLLTIVLMRDVIVAFADEAARARTAAQPMRQIPGESVAAKVRWPVLLRSFVMIAGLFAVVLFFGSVAGLTATALIVLYWHVDLSLPRSLVGAFAIGFAVPVLFSVALSVPLWAGLVPEIIPGWLGGGILPSL